MDKECNKITLMDILGTDRDSVLDNIEHFYDNETVRKYILKLYTGERKVLECEVRVT